MRESIPEAKESAKMAEDGMNGEDDRLDGAIRMGPR